ncbi:glycosyltransferase family 2 protein [Psychromonas sp. MB-3u-54]|uniref:glycosyltransferase family 2 protein n=1 Tax=Psychromonas sp. MB-3u-54 TaxID=2058319 RepID=UPI000C342D5C|nr:glycosyltransferase family A protein [Psychromonas sp. MB-3u-54]PKH03004.1 glycosyltransferase family 2 protein [Psychromonas sp. MB-3u-54]
MNKIKFSVVIPLFNKTKSVCRTLDSIIKQRFQAAEIIIVDDGSTDDSAEKVLALNLPQVRLVKQANLGVSAARNYGVSLAKYEHIAFIDADDQWSPFFLLEMSKLIERFPGHEFFASNYQKVCNHDVFIDPKLAIGHIPPRGSVLDNYFTIAGHGDLPFMVSSTVITRRLFKQVGGFPVGEIMGEDQALFSQVALWASIVYSPLILLKYHTDSENRACDRHLPNDLLPFAKRLVDWVDNESHDAHLNEAILTYCAAHICQLVKLNLGVGNLVIAQQLLKYPCCKLKPFHFVGFYLWLFMKLISSPRAYLTQLKGSSININSL